MTDRERGARHLPSISQSSSAPVYAERQFIWRELSLLEYF